MNEVIIIDDEFWCAGFTSGYEGVWTRNEPDDPPVNDYRTLSRKLDVELSRFIRPYQASGDKVEIVNITHGGSGVIKDNDLKKVDGIVTAEKELVLSVIAADCVPIYLIDKNVNVVGLLHCGWKSASVMLVHNAVEQMKKLGASADEVQLIIGPHICPDCYEVGEEVRSYYANVFTDKELDSIFSVRNEKSYLDLSAAIKLKAIYEGILSENISVVNRCTCHDKSFYSYRRGDRGKQNLAFIMMKN